MRKSNGHYCRICGEHKANEKFSGRGHASHICKKCAALPVSEQSELLAINKIHGMASRHLNESEIKWLRGKMNDSRPVVRESAVEIHRLKFPRYERNMTKKGATALSLELYINGEVWDEFGDSLTVNARIFASRTGEFRYIDYNTPGITQEKIVSVELREARRLLKAVIHELDALFWDVDFSDGEYDIDPLLDILPEHIHECEAANSEPKADEISKETQNPVWSLSLELNNGEQKDIVFHHVIHDAPVELFWLLMGYFDEDEDIQFSI